MKTLILEILPSSTGLGLLVWLVLWFTSLLWSMQCCGDCRVPLLDHWYILHAKISMNMRVKLFISCRQPLLE